ncbi:MAG: CaiB/BaiF CoA transferase family protein [Hyphomicrobiaceae bacterium]
MTNPPLSRGALDGLIVLELTTMLAGPFAGMLLADQGARVIKIEPPGGESTRQVGPHPDGAIAPNEGGYGAYFASINRNKESLTLDLKSPQGKDIFRRLAAQSDVLLENYRAGVMERLDLSYESLRADNPKLVYAALRGFGDPRTGESPLVHWPAYDVVSQAMGGLMAITGTQKGGEPTKVGPGVGDLIPAMQSVIGILAAVWRADRSGHGQLVDVGMVDSVLSICERAIYQRSYTGAIAGPEGNGHPLLCPFGMYPAKDGYVAIGIPRDDFFALFADLIGQPELKTDPRYTKNDERVRRRDEVEAIVTNWTSARTKSQIAEILGGNVPFGPIQTADEIMGAAHTAARDMLAEVEHPGTDRTYTLVNTSIKLTDTPGGIKRRAPLAGEHNSQVLADFGFSPTEIEIAQRSGAID